MDFLKLPSFPILFSFLLFLLMVLTILIKTTKPSSSSKLPPGPWKLPLIGNIPQLLGSTPLHHKLKHLATKHGPLMYLKIGQIPTIIASSPDYAKEIMRTHDLNFSSRPQIIYSQVMVYDYSDIGFCPYGEYWRQVRKIFVQELFNPTRVESIFKPIRKQELFGLVEWIGLNEGLAININDKVSLALCSIISRATCGDKKRVNNEEILYVLMKSVEVSLGFEVADYFPSVSLFSYISRSKPKLIKLRERISRLFDKVIEEHQEKKSTITSDDNIDEELFEDMFDVLLKYYNNGGNRFSLTLDNIKAIVWDLYSAGIETSTTTIEWAMAELIKNPIIMKKAQEEVREVFNRKGSSNIDETMLSEMTYLISIVKETMRLHPSLPFLIPRESQHDCEINGFVIPAKTRAMVNVWAIARDPKYWTEPESFIPERWFNSSIDSKGNHFEYLPFGAGRRICAGISLGLVNVEFTLALLLYHFNWKLPNGMKHEDLDMIESLGATLKRKNVLHLIPTAYIN
ncbi:LOW QUALITY PROTEIN: cytochrome P450 71D9 [Cannabis sativa]|uniref:LOW QUALITY PROTEIN: cytochrome P450 71D9 n=1 Tax=Cannabis sativa TaxID=3483 RepID=UPI0029CA99AB|nr:LOW QUALITY PROTEIN: cytochrome P450 71D9 [Cannabis sativa]